MWCVMVKHNFISILWIGVSLCFVEAIICVSRRLRLLQRTAFCILRLQQTYHWILFEIFVGGIFWWPKGTDRAKSIENPTRINSLLTGTFSFLDWKVVEFRTVFFSSLNSFLQDVSSADQEKFENSKKCKQSGTTHLPLPDPKLTQAGYQLTVIGARGGVGGKFLRSRLTLIQTMNGKIKYKCE